MIVELGESQPRLFRRGLTINEKVKRAENSTFSGADETRSGYVQYIQGIYVTDKTLTSLLRIASH